VKKENVSGVNRKKTYFTLVESVFYGHGPADYNIISRDIMQRAHKGKGDSVPYKTHLKPQ
jgi:hypothetical protein